ncbi:hypothetical protein LZ30DRAFT_126896 [Colletotrichum cereale]|nr:hypothetical protein LZ30DRAFT_126896 [Colletotrichum cereale]
MGSFLVDKGCTYGGSIGESISSLPVSAHLAASTFSSPCPFHLSPILPRLALRPKPLQSASCPAKGSNQLPTHAGHSQNPSVSRSLGSLRSLVLSNRSRVITPPSTCFMGPAWVAEHPRQFVMRTRTSHIVTPCSASPATLPSTYCGHLVHSSRDEKQVLTPRGTNAPVAQSRIETAAEMSQNSSFLQRYWVLKCLSSTANLSLHGWRHRVDGTSDVVISAAGFINRVSLMQ